MPLSTTPATAHWLPESEDIALLDETIGALLDRQAGALPERVALVYRYPELGIEARWTYREYRARADALAKGLIARGVAAGERVAVLGPNLPQWILLELALAKIGAIMVTVNPGYRKSELQYVLAQAEVSLLCVVKSYRDNDYRAIFGAPASELRTALPTLRGIVLMDGDAQPGFESFAELIGAGATVSDATLAARQAAVRPADVAQIEFTSGTTGFPKGAMLTHHACVNNAWVSVRRMDVAADDVYVTPMPLFHAAGCILGVLGMMAAGATMVVGITFDPRKMLELVAAERATILQGSPTMFIAMLQHPEYREGKYAFPALRMIVTGGTPIPVPLMEEIKAKWGADPMIGMGMTECSPMITFTLARDSFERKSATVGRPLAHTEVRIADPASGRVCALGEQGELQIRGYLLMAGYYKMPEKTREAIDAEGWLHSGDLATLDRDGYVRIVGRVKDMIIRGGENVYPAEIEAYLMRHPAIAEAQVVGVPDAYMGEEACAFVRLRPGAALDADGVRNHVRAGLARYKVPKHVRFVDEYPTTPSGKVKKFELREGFVREGAADRPLDRT